MDNALWWSGVFAWCFFGILGFAWSLEWTTDFLVGIFWSKKELLLFLVGRLAERGQELGEPPERVEHIKKVAESVLEKN